ncbi:tetratricopeptide repeat protein [Psychrosphaera sp.]|nr:tetratricopeptide repeat protein [Psychrosphaera sp.]
MKAFNTNNITANITTNTRKTQSFKSATLLKTATLAVSLLVSNLAFAGQSEIDQIERAASVLNTTELQTLAESFSGYDKAFSLYRLALSHSLVGDKEMADESIDEAMGIMESLNETQPDSVEFKALLAQIYGFKIALEPMKGPYYGIKSNQLLEEAETLAENHPRVQLVKGIAKYNTPPMFGGGKDHAKTAFQQAIAAYENDKYSNYHWGEAEAYTWLGLIKLQEGNKALAQADWQQALEINPDYGWAKMLVQQNK